MKYLDKIIFLTLALPLQTLAQTTIAEKLIICGRTIDDPCDFTHLMQMLNSLINVIIEISLAITVIVLLIVGARYLFAGSSDQKTQAKESFTKLAIGFGFILGGWLIVNTLFMIAGVDTAFNFLG